MKTEIVGETCSKTVNTDVVKHRFASLDGGGYCETQAKALGVYAADTDSGEEAPVVVTGIVLVETAEACYAGYPIISDSNGKAVLGSDGDVTMPAGSTPVTANAAAPNFALTGSMFPDIINGWCLDDCTGAGEFVRVKLV